MASLKTRLTHAWNALKWAETPESHDRGYYRGTATSYPMHRPTPFQRSNFTAAIYNRIALDIAVTEFKHVKMDPKTKRRETVDSSINKRLTYEANKDQTYIQLMQDIVYSMFDEGVVALVPIDTDTNITEHSVYSIDSWRVGKILRWFADDVELLVYNDREVRMQQVILPKNRICIFENPLYAVINGPNLTLNRLVTKMTLVDNIDNITGSGRLDILVQLPYSATNSVRRTSVDDRITQIENDLSRGTNGIAYIQHNESVVQLNRPANSQILEQVDKLKQEFYNQLGMTENIMKGTASEAELRSYYARSIDPIIQTITAEMNRKFLTKTAHTQGHRIEAYRDVFQFVSTQQIAELSDKLKRNMIADTNEIRGFIGLEPRTEDEASQLVNPNMPIDDQTPSGGGTSKDKRVADLKDFPSTEEELAERQNDSEEESEE